MELTVRQMENLVYRKKRLRDAVRQLEPLLSGGNVSLLPRVWTKTGLYSEKQVWALIEELLAALEKYERYCAYYGNSNPVLAELPYRLTERSRSLFQSFLYCSIRLASSGPYWLCEAKGTFDDILTLAEQTQYSDKIELYFDELYHRPEMDGFFAYMDRIYELFSGEKIETTIPEKDRQAVLKRHQAEIAEQEAARTAYPDLSPEEQAEIDREWYESLSEEEKSEADRDAEEYLWEEREKQLWLKAFQEKETFCRQYLLFRKLYFEETARRSLSQKVERMLDIYLYEQGESAFLEDGTFFYTYTLINKVLRQVRDLGRTEADG